MGFSLPEPYASSHSHLSQPVTVALTSTSDEACWTTQEAGGGMSYQRLFVLLTHPGGMVGYPPPPPCSHHPFHCWACLPASSFCPFLHFLLKSVDSSRSCPGYLPNSETGDIPASGLSERQCWWEKPLRLSAQTLR